MHQRALFFLRSLPLPAASSRSSLVLALAARMKALASPRRLSLGTVLYEEPEPELCLSSGLRKR